MEPDVVGSSPTVDESSLSSAGRAPYVLRRRNPSLKFFWKGGARKGSVCTQLFPATSPSYRADKFRGSEVTTAPPSATCPPCLFFGGGSERGYFDLLSQPVPRSFNPLQPSLEHLRSRDEEHRRRISYAPSPSRSLLVLWVRLFLFEVAAFGVTSTAGANPVGLLDSE